MEQKEELKQSAIAPHVLVFRPAVAEDVSAVGEILRSAVDRMLVEGKCQWNRRYPNESHVSEDIANGVGYVLEAGGEVLGYGAVVFTGEPAYSKIEGEWLSDERYVVVHRMAVKQSEQRRGLGREFFRAVERLAVSRNIRSVRVDTNFDNARMLSLIAKAGFTYCGEIQYESGSRMAYEKMLTLND